MEGSNARQDRADRLAEACRERCRLECASRELVHGLRNGAQYPGVRLLSIEGCSVRSVLPVAARKGAMSYRYQMRSRKPLRKYVRYGMKSWS